MNLALRATVLALALAALVLAAAGPATAEPIFPYETHVETLDNGLNVVLVPMDSGGLVSAWTIVRTGSRDEFEEGRSGFAHFFEHMMFRGTEAYPQDVYAELITKIGADANAFTSTDLTAYYNTIAAEDLELVLELESDRFQNLSYAEDVFRTEAGAIYGEYRKNFANPYFGLREKLAETAFTTHTYGHTTMGYERDIAGMPELYEYSKSFFQRYYRPDNTVLLIVGDIEVQPTMELVQRFYGGWQAGYTAPEVPVEPEQAEERRVAVPYQGASKPIVWLGYKGPAFDPADRVQAAGNLLCDLAFGQTSEFYQRMVLDEQRLEFVACSFGMDRDPGLIDIYTRLRNEGEDEVNAVIAEIDATLATFRTTPAPAEKLADLKSRLRYGFLMNLDSPSAVAGALVRHLAVTGAFESVNTYYETLAEVTAEDVQKAADTYFQNQRRTVAVLTGGAS